MKAMITGAAGFIGTAPTKYCSEARCLVLGFDIRDPSCDWTGNAFELCDVRNATRLTELLSRFRPERIFHLAAQSYPTVSLLQPRETVDVYVGGSVNLYECLHAENLSPAVKMFSV